MSDLTDEEIGHWRSVKAGREMFGIELDHAQRHLMRAIDELQRHRSALAADRERVWSVVADIVDEALSDAGPERNDLIIEFIATRVADQLAGCSVNPVSSRACEVGTKGCVTRHVAAEQLATTGVRLSDVDRVRLRSIRELLDRQPDVWDLEANLIDRIIGAPK